MLSRKHFRAIADAFCENENRADIITALCRYLKSENPEFRAGQFFDACMYNPIEKLKP